MFLRFWYYDIKKSAKRACLININHAPCQLLSDSGMQTFLLSIILFCRLQVEPVRTAQLKVTSLWLGLIRESSRTLWINLIVKSKGFKKVMNVQCHNPARICQDLNFCFPCKRELYLLRSQYWETSADSLNFSQQLLNFCFISLSSSIMCAKIQIVFTLARLWHWPFTTF